MSFAPAAESGRENFTSQRVDPSVFESATTPPVSRDVKMVNGANTTSPPSTTLYTSTPVSPEAAVADQFNCPVAATMEYTAFFGAGVKIVVRAESMVLM